MTEIVVAGPDSQSGAPRPATDQDRKAARSIAVTAAVAYLLLVAIMWGPFNLYSGMPGETSFPYMSRTQGTFGGFLYRYDPLRIHTNTFYHLSYVLGEILGIGGSYVPYQIVYAALWWARGCLMFLLVRRFVPQHQLVAYVAGALTIAHASDRSLQWIGQMNQFGFIFWMMLAFYTFTVGWESSSRLR